MEMSSYNEEIKGYTEPKRSSRVRSYCFTLNNYTEEEYTEICKELKVYDYYVIGKEIGESGTPHLQGFVFYEKKISWATLKRLMPKAAIFESKAKGKKMSNAWNYCKKEGNFIEYGEPPAQGKRTDLTQFREAVDSGTRSRLTLMREHEGVYANHPNYVNEYLARTRIEQMTAPAIELREWQIELLGELEQEPEDRVIHWIWSQESLTGKSTFLKYVAAKYKDQFLGTDDLNKRNILCAYDEQKIIHIDLARDLTMEQRNYLKSTLETLSDQKLHFSGKYHSGMKYVKAHIVVTANQPPVDGLPYRYHEWKITNSDSYVKTNWAKKLIGGDGREYFQRESYTFNIGLSMWKLHLERVYEAKYLTPIINN